MDLRKNSSLTPLESGFPIQAITMNLTTGCPFSCDYCFSGCFKDYKPQRMSEETALKIVDWLMLESTRGTNNIVDIGFWGGEPLVEWDLIKKIVLYAEEKAKENNIGVTFGGTTNIFLLTEDKFDFMEQHNIHFLLSCDGVQRHHDKFRKLKSGEGSWKYIDKNMDKIIQRWPEQEVRMSFTAENVSEMIEDLDYFISKGFKHIVYSPVSEGDWNETRIAELKKTWNDIVDWYLKDEKYKNISVKFIDDACNHVVNQSVENNAPCGAGRGYIGINYDGALYPCVPPETLIQTEESTRRIDSLNVGDKVLTHTNRYMPITKIWRKQYYGNVVNIKTKAIDLPIICTEDHKLYVKRDNKFQWIEANKITKEDLIPYPIKSNKTDINKISFSKAFTGWDTIELEIDEDLMFILGKLLGRDTISIEPLRISNKNKEILEKTKRILEEKFKTSCPYAGVGDNRHLKQWNGWLKNWFGDNYHGAYKYAYVRLDSWMLELDNNLISAFLDGFFGTEEVAINNHKIFNQIKQMLFKIGEYPEVRKNDLGEYLVKRNVNNLFDFDEEYVYLRIEEIKKYEKNGEVFNLEVEEDHSYTGENVIFKNCHRFCKFEDPREWFEKEVVLGHIDFGILNHEWRQKFIDWQPDRDCPSQCKDCSAYKITCTGGCWATNYDLMGDISIPPEINCISATETLKQAHKMIENVGIEFYQPQSQENILPEVQGCQCYNIEDLLYGRFKLNNHEPYKCLCNMSSYGEKEKKLRSCTCYNIENDGRGFFDRSGTSCKLFTGSPIDKALEYIEEMKKRNEESLIEESEKINKFLEEKAGLEMSEQLLEDLKFTSEINDDTGT